MKSTGIARSNLPALAVVFLVVLLPFDFFLAPAIVLLIAAVFFTQPLRQSISNLKQNAVFLLFSGAYLLYVLGLWHTELMDIGYRELEYKLSILILPIVIAAMNQLSKTAFRRIKLSFIASLCVAALLSIYISSAEVAFAYLPTYIELSVFIHPTYFAVYINLALIFLIKYIAVASNKKQLLLIYIILAFLLVFSYLLNTKIGMITTLLLLLILLFQRLVSFSKIMAGTAVVVFVLALFLVYNYVPAVNKRFQSTKKVMHVDQISKDTKESSALRILIWEEAFQIIKENPLIGVGTGDSKAALMEKYQKDKITFARESRLNAHNQFLEWGITFGLLGGIYWLLTFIWPIFLAISHKNTLYLYFMFILFMVFTVESFIEREAGVVFFSLFNSLLFFHAPKKH